MGFFVDFDECNDSLSLVEHFLVSKSFPISDDETEVEKMTIKNSK